MRDLAEGQRNWVCNLANASSLLWHMYHSLGSPLSSVNWAGFYVLDTRDSSRLILGPFHGRVACQTIQIGKGLCGTVAREGETLLLDDVETFPGHIACDGETRSEVVAPIKVGEKVSRPPTSTQKSSARILAGLHSRQGGRSHRYRLCGPARI